MKTVIPWSQAWVIASTAMLMGHAVAQSGDQTPTLSYAQSPHTDRFDREWNIDQNGNIQRGNTQNSLISNAAVLMLGNQQFYCQQPLISPDGRSMEMRGPKPYNGVAVTRRLRFLEKEGGVVWADEFSNSSTRMIRTVVEIRHHFSGQIKTVVTDAGRDSPNALEKGESGVVVVPAQADGSIPLVTVSIAGKRQPTPPRLAIRSSYQLSVFHSLEIAPASSVTLVHATGQSDFSGDTATETVTKAFQPWQLKRIAKVVPRSWMRNPHNYVQSSPLNTLQAWFPSAHWGIERGGADVLSLGDDSQLKGRAEVENAVLHHAFGRLPLDWKDVAAIAGPRSKQHWAPRVWLADGQILEGRITADKAVFQLLSGATMPLQFERLDRLVRGLNHGPESGVPDEPPPGLIEFWNGERIAIGSGSVWPLVAEWGTLSPGWDSFAAWLAADDPNLPPLLLLRNGTRIHALAANGPLEMATLRFGNQSVKPSRLRQAMQTVAISSLSNDDLEPAEPFVDLVGEQRIVARVTNPMLTIATEAGPLTISPGEIREWTDITDDLAPQTGLNEHWQKLELWGGGSVTGRVQNTSLSLEAPGLQWRVPVADVRRLSNPIPKIEESVMRRVAGLIERLGHAEWKERETATAELTELGALAQGSLREALRHATDPEVIRRLEQLLSSEP